jgi:hypothetical protein
MDASAVPRAGGFEREARPVTSPCGSRPAACRAAVGGAVPRPVGTGVINPRLQSMTASGFAVEPAEAGPGDVIPHAPELHDPQRPAPHRRRRSL